MNLFSSTPGVAGKTITDHSFLLMYLVDSRRHLPLSTCGSFPTLKVHLYPRSGLQFPGAAQMPHWGDGPGTLVGDHSSC